MAEFFIDSNATGSNDGSSFADAFVNITSAVPVTRRGDTCWVASDHDQDVNSSTGHIELGSYLGRGNFGEPITVVSANSTTGAYEAGATFRGIGNYNIKTGNNAVLSLWGLVLRADATGADLFISYGNDCVTYYFDCSFHVHDRFWQNYSTDSRTLFCNCDLSLSAAQGELFMNGRQASVDWRGGAISAGVSSFLLNDAYGAQTVYRAVDISGHTQGVNPHPSNKGQQHLFTGCAVGDNFNMTQYYWNDGSDAPDQVMLSEYCGSGTVSAPVEGLTEKLDYGGRTTLDTARYRDTGAMSAVSSARYCHALKSRNNYGSQNDGHRSVDLLAKVRGGSEVTITVYFASGGLLYDDEIWCDVFAPSEGTTAQQEYGSTRRANPAVTRAALPADEVSAWTGSGVGTQQKMTYTWTPAQNGLCRAAITWAKGGGSWVYVDPRLEVA